MADAVDKAARVAEDGASTRIQVIADGDDYWPLPWYLRKYPNVGYWNTVDDSVGQAPIILSNAKHERSLLAILYSVPEAGQRHLYVPLFDEALSLRPGVQWQGYIRSDLWEQVHHSEDLPPQSSKPEESMVQAQQDKKNIPDLVKFSHRAMHANFEVFIQDSRGSYAGRAARAAFNEVDRLEGILSRYIENSDVSRINSLSPGQDTMVDEDTLRCLQIAQRAGQLTDGAFDVTIGNLITAWKTDDAQAIQSLLANRPTQKMLKLNADDFTVTVTGQGVALDLGGIGKGYAVDVIAETLDEWGVDKALIHAGASSIRALNPPSGKNGWPVTLTNPIDQTTIARLEMKNEVFSCSGLQGGQHIINPFTGQAVSDRRACWMRLKQNAALLDALTTAGMIMPEGNLHSLQDALAGLSVMVLMTPQDQSPKLIKLGQWPTE
jgi:thiamine biosynthesis lipoprotein